MFQPRLKCLSFIYNFMEKRTENLIWILIALVSVVAAVAIIIAILFGGNYHNESTMVLSLVSTSSRKAEFFPVLSV